MARICSAVAVQMKVLPLALCALRYSSILAMRSGAERTLYA